MKGSSHVFIVALVMAMTSNAVYAAGKGTTVVYPTGSSPTDVNNVQAAVNAGGTVLLKATNRAGQPTAFNFNDPQEGIVPGAGQVLLSADVSIVGEKVGSHPTTIQGGLAPIQTGPAAGKVSITGLKFQDPKISAITIVHCTGLQIVGNEIDGVVPALINFGFTEGDAIDVFGSTTADGNTVSGSVLIANNYIHGLTAEFAFGIQFDSVAANTLITGNLVEVAELPTNNPFVVDIEGITVERSTGPCAIAGNAVYIGGGFAYDAIAAYAPGPQFSITDNAIYSESPDADGIVLTGSPGLGGPANAVSVARNLVVMHKSQFGGITLYAQVTNCTIANNLIAGDAAYALDAQADPDDAITGNRFLDNDVTHLTASVASIYLSANTSNNFVRTSRVSVIDLGTGNQVVFH